MSDVSVLGGGALRRRLGHEDKTHKWDECSYKRNHIETPPQTYFCKWIIAVFAFVNYLFSLVSLKILSLWYFTALLNCFTVLLIMHSIQGTFFWGVQFFCRKVSSYYLFKYYLRIISAILSNRKFYVEVPQFVLFYLLFIFFLIFLDKFFKLSFN